MLQYRRKHDARLTVIKVLFFDIGYTLVNEDAAWDKRCEIQAATEEAKALGLSAKKIFRELENASAARLSPYKTFIGKFNLQKIPYCHDLETLYRDTERILKTLAGKYELGIIANQSDGLCDRLKSFNILQYLTHVVSSYDVKVAKPDIRIFEYALNLADCLPCEAVMIGDRLDNDIEPAKAVGMKTVWIKHGFGRFQTPIPHNEPDYIIDELSELSEIF